MVGLFWVCFGFVPHGASWLGFGWGGSTPGPFNLSLEGLLDPSGLSPEVTEWVTPDCAAGHRDSGFTGFLCCL
jgi:hypothetical protein